MNRDQLIASGQALLDLDARGALVPHGIGGHARSIIEGFIALERPPAPDQTNAEVSDERLPFDHQQQADNYLEALLGYSGGFYGAAIKAGLPAAETVGPIAHIERAARELHRLALNRRSVTSQASEGEVAGWFWRWASSDEWRPLSRSGTEAGRADFVRDQEKIAPVVVAQLYLVAPSKRVVETGWLIEINSRSTGPTWFSMSETEGDGGFFTKDSLKALRFGRKEDAQAYIDDIGWTEAIPTEHEWSEPPQALQGGRS